MGRTTSYRRHNRAAFASASPPAPTRASMGWMALVASALLAACGPAAKVAAPPPLPEVGVITIQPRSTPLSLEIVGDIRAFREVELRPRVSGVVEKQLFTPGQMVREGQPPVRSTPKWPTRRHA